MIVADNTLAIPLGWPFFSYQRFATPGFPGDFAESRPEKNSGKSLLTEIYDFRDSHERT